MTQRDEQLDEAAELIQSKRASRSVMNGCKALMVLMEAGEPLSLKAFSREAKLAPATAHRILRSLVLCQFARQTSDGAYELGLRLLELGSAVAEQFDIVRMARPYMQRLAQLTGETIHLAVLEGDGAVYISKVEGNHSIRLVSRPGYRVPLHATSLGKVLSAGLEEVAFGALLERLTPTLTDEEIERFKHDVEDARRTGWATDREELLPGLMCVGTPVLDRDGHTIAAVSVAGPTFRMETSVKQHVETLREVVGELCSELGYTPVRADRQASRR